jgi:hypothetical protein
MWHKIEVDMLRVLFSKQLVIMPEGKMLQKYKPYDKR